jgi:Protein of unknown function (DUF2950)
MLTGQSDKAPGGAKNYVVNGKMTGGFAFVAYPVEYGNSGGDDIQHEPGWRSASEGSGKGDHRDSDRNDRVRP